MITAGYFEDQQRFWTKMRDHHIERSERGFETDEYHAEQAEYCDAYLEAASADFARQRGEA